MSARITGDKSDPRLALNQSALQFRPGSVPPVLTTPTCRELSRPKSSRVCPLSHTEGGDQSRRIGFAVLAEVVPLQICTVGIKQQDVHQVVLKSSLNDQPSR